MSVQRTDLVKMGQHLATLRKNKKMTQMKLAEILDVSNKTVSKWEKGDIAPDITLLKPLADVLEVSVDELLVGDNVDNSNYVVSYYKKFNKKRFLKEISILTTIVLLIVILVAAIERYYTWSVDTLTGGDDNYAHGYVFKNNDNLKLLIDSIDLDPDFNNIKVKTIKVSLVSNDEILVKKESTYSDMFLVDALDKVMLFYENNIGDLNMDDLFLNIEYSTDGVNKEYINIFLKK